MAAALGNPIRLPQDRRHPPQTIGCEAFKWGASATGSRRAWVQLPVSNGTAVQKLWFVTAPIFPPLSYDARTRETLGDMARLDLFKIQVGR